MSSDWLNFSVFQGQTSQPLSPLANWETTAWFLDAALADFVSLQKVISHRLQPNLFFTSLVSEPRMNYLQDLHEALSTALGLLNLATSKEENKRLLPVENEYAL